MSVPTAQAYMEAAKFGKRAIVAHLARTAALAVLKNKLDRHELRLVADALRDDDWDDLHRLLKNLLNPLGGPQCRT
jgi:hypothetical protein